MFDLPLEYALIKFEDAKPTGKIVPELLDLAGRGIVRFIDIVFIQKEADGNMRTIELNDLDPESYAMFVPMGEHVSSLFTNDDLADRGQQTPREFSGDAHLVGKPVGRRSPQSRPGRWRPAGGACTDCSRSGRAVRKRTGGGIRPDLETH